MLYKECQNEATGGISGVTWH